MTHSVKKVFRWINFLGFTSCSIKQHIKYCAYKYTVACGKELKDSPVSEAEAEVSVTLGISRGAGFGGGVLRGLDTLSGSSSVTSD